MKKYRITDADGEMLEVEEIDEVTHDDDIEEVVELTTDEIRALKELVGKIPELLALVETKEEVPAEGMDEDEPIVEDEETEEVEEDIDEEQVVDVKSCDSAASIGSIEKRQTSVDDSLVDDISLAWAKRFGGK